MKGVVLDMKDLTDSRELMERREPPKIRWFVYILLVALIVALLFSWFFEIDDFVKATGEVKTADVSSDIVLGVNSKLKEKKVKEGDLVKSGDTLFTFDVEYAQEQMELIEEQIDKYSVSCEKTKKLKKSIEDEKNYFSNTGDDAEYYYRFEQYKSTGRLSALEITDTKEKNELEHEQTEQKIKTYKQKLNENECRVEELENLIETVYQDEEYDGNDSYTASLYSEYKTTLERAKLTEEQCRYTYERLVEKYNNQAEQGLVTASDVNAAKTRVEESKAEYEAYKKSMLNQVDEQLLKLELMETEDQSNKSGEELTASQNEIAERKTNLLKLKIAIETGKEFDGSDIELIEWYWAYIEKERDLYLISEETESEFYELQDAYQAQETREEITIDMIEEAGIAYDDSCLSVQSVRDKFISQLESKVDSLKLEIATLKSNIEDLEITLDKKQNTDLYGELTEDKMKSEAIVTVNQEIDTLENSTRTAQSKLSELKEIVDNGEVKANYNGKVTLLEEMNPGDFIQAGTKMCSIIPEGDVLRAVLYIPESDIAKVKQGCRTEYLIDAIPYNEYGHISGRITNLTADSVSLESTSKKYYLAWAEIPSAEMKNKKGEVRRIQNGMMLEAKIICGSKKALFWILEKVNLID